MKNVIKKFVALAMVMSICIGCFMDANRMFKVSAATVATFTIHSDPEGYWGPNQNLQVGKHAFLSIRNKTNSTIYVLGVPVTPNGAITVGTYGNQLSKYGQGVFTNLDAYRIKYKGKYKTRVSLSMNIDYAQLNTIQQTMRVNNEYSYYHNCAWFSERVWNSVAPASKHISACGWDTVCNPLALANSIKSKKGWKKAAQIGTCDKTDVRRIWKQGYLKVNSKDIK